MATNPTIKPRRGTSTPGIGAINQNELAVDTTNKRIYIGAADGSGTLIGAAPGGSDTQVQFNDGGNLGGDSGLTYNKSTDTLTVGSLVSTGNLTVDTNTFFVDSTNNRIGVNTVTPAYQVEIENTGANALLVLDRTDGAACFIEGQATRSAFGSVGATPLVLAYNSLAVVEIGAGGAITVNPDGGDPFTFPTADGTANQYLQTNGSGTVSWASAVSSVNGSSGAITNIATTNSDNNFSVAQTFQSGLNVNGTVVFTFEGASTDDFETSLLVTDPTADRTITIPDETGTIALTANKLSVFAATTSSELAGVISDETGTGALVFGTSPSFTTSVVTGSTSFNVFNTTATTINAFGAATTLSIGSATGTATINNANTVVAGDLAVNGGDITTTVTGTATVFNTTATTVNAFGAATSLSIGSTTTATQTINIGTGITGNTFVKTINIGTNGGIGSTTSVYIGGNQSSDSVYVPNNLYFNIAGDNAIYTSNASMSAPANMAIYTSGDILNIGGDNAGLIVTIGDHDGNNNATYLVVDESNTSVSVNANSGFNVNGFVSIGSTGAEIATTITGTASLFNTNATTVNIAGAGTTVSIGAATGTTTINNKVSSSLGYAVSSSAINTQTGTSYTLLSGDNGKIVTLNNGSPITLTVPSGLDTGFNCTLVQLGSGQVTITASGTTLNSYGGALKIAGQYGAATLISYSSNTYSVSGTLTT